MLTWCNNSGRVWRKIPESKAQSLDSYLTSFRLCGLLSFNSGDREKTVSFWSVVSFWSIIQKFNVTRDAKRNWHCRWIALMFISLWWGWPSRLTGCYTSRTNQLIILNAKTASHLPLFFLKIKKSKNLQSFFWSSVTCVAECARIGTLICYWLSKHLFLYILVDYLHASLISYVSYDTDRDRRRLRSVLFCRLPVIVNGASTEPPVPILNAWNKRQQEQHNNNLKTSPFRFLVYS